MRACHPLKPFVVALATLAALPAARSHAEEVGQPEPEEQRPWRLRRSQNDRFDDEREEAYRNRLPIGVALLGQDFFRGTRSNIDGSHGSGPSFFFLITAGFDTDLGQFWTLSAWVGYAPFGSNAQGDTQHRSILPAALRLGHEFPAGWEARFGLGVLFYTIRGDGGNLRLSNGNGTSAFALPSGSQTTRTFFYDFSVGKTFGKIRTDLDMLVTAIYTGRRAMHLVFGVSYNFL